MSGGSLLGLHPATSESLLNQAESTSESPSHAPDRPNARSAGWAAAPAPRGSCKPLDCSAPESLDHFQETPSMSGSNGSIPAVPAGWHDELSPVINTHIQNSLVALGEAPSGWRKAAAAARAAQWAY